MCVSARACACVYALCIDVRVLHVRVDEGRCGIESDFIPTEVPNFTCILHANVR